MSIGRLGDAHRSWRANGWNRLARAAPDPNAITQVLPVIRTDAPAADEVEDVDADDAVQAQPVGARHPAGRDLTWARHSYQGQRRTSAPVSRPRLLIVFGLVAATALATVMTLVGREQDVPEPSPDSDDSLLIAPGVPGDDPPMPIVPPPPPSPTGPTDDARPSASAHPSKTPPSSTPGPNGQIRVTPGPRSVPTRTSAPVASASPGARSAAVVSFEAEASANTLGGSATSQSVPQVSGGRVVTNLGRVGTRPEGWLRFNGVRAPGPGRYALTVYYLSADASTATVRVNGELLPDPLAFPSTSSVRSVTVVVSLRAGANSIQFGNPDRVAPSIDRVTLRAL